MAAGPTAAVETYNLMTNAWTREPALPAALVAPAVGRAGERLVVSGGQLGSGAASNKTWGLPLSKSQQQ